MLSTDDYEIFLDNSIVETQSKFSFCKVSLTCRQWSVVKLDIAVRWLMRQCGRPQTDCRHACMKLVHQLAPCITGKITSLYKKMASYIYMCWYYKLTFIWDDFISQFSFDELDCSKFDRHGRASLQRWNFNDKEDIVNFLKLSCI